MVAILTVLAILATVALVVWIVSLVNSPTRQRNKLQMLELERETKVSRNHQDMFVMLSELSFRDGITPLFPAEEAEKVKQLLKTYREETTK